MIILILINVAINKIIILILIVFFVFFSNPKPQSHLINFNNRSCLRRDLTKAINLIPEMLVSEKIQSGYVENQKCVRKNGSERAFGSSYP